jgi:hypothetical protein
MKRKQAPKSKKTVARKVVTKDKKEKKEKKGKTVKAIRGDYKYSKLSELINKEVERAYAYAVIADCSAPYYVKECEKYLCTLKLIDETVNPNEATKNKPGYLNTTMFAISKSELPVASKIGSIIRIHRGQTHKYKGGFQFNCDVNIKGAWLLFDPTEGPLPIAQNSRHFTWNESDKKRLKEIRGFGKKLYSDFDPTDVSGLGDKKDEFDLIGMLLERKTKNKETDRLLLTDGKDIYKIEVPAKKYGSISPQDVIRARAIFVSKKGKIAKYTVSEFSNVIKIPNEFKVASALLAKINKLDDKNEVKKQINLYSPPKAGERQVVSAVTEKNMKVSKLRDLFAPDAGKKADKRFRVKANVIEIGPKSPKDWIIAGDKKKHKGEYYKLQLFVKDVSAEDNNIYTLFLCTVDGKGKEFISIPPAHDADTINELKGIYKTLMKPWVNLDLIVEKVATSEGQPIYFIVDIKLTI